MHKRDGQKDDVRNRTQQISCGVFVSQCDQSDGRGRHNQFGRKGGEQQKRRREQCDGADNEFCDGNRGQKQIEKDMPLVNGRYRIAHAPARPILNPPFQIRRQLNIAALPPELAGAEGGKIAGKLVDAVKAARNAPGKRTFDKIVA